MPSSRRRFCILEGVTAVEVASDRVTSQAVASACRRIAPAPHAHAIPRNSSEVNGARSGSFGSAVRSSFESSFV